MKERGPENVGVPEHESVTGRVAGKLESSISHSENFGKIGWFADAIGPGKSQQPEYKGIQ